MSNPVVANGQAERTRLPSGGSRSHVVNPPSASAPLADRVGHSDPTRYVRRSGVHSGAGSMEYASLLEGTDFSANLFFVHRGVLLPGGGIGQHFHNICEEMYVIFDNEAEFTVDGRTARLEGPAAAPCRLGHSHAILNRSSTPTEFMNICVSVRKGTYDTFDLEDDRVDTTPDARPSFMSIRLDSSVVADRDSTQVRRLLVPGIFLGPWRYVDYYTISPGGSYHEHARTDVEEFAYVLAGSGRVQVDDEEVAVRPGDAVPVLHGQARSFGCDGEVPLELMVVGIEVT